MMAKPTDIWLPIWTEDDDNLNDADISYARSFTEVARLFAHFEDEQQSERIALRLSTCRNAFLTANAIYRDFSGLLGFGRFPPPLVQSIAHLSRGEVRECRKYRVIAGRVVGQIRLKFRVWDTRLDLDAAVAGYIASRSPLEQVAIHRLLAEDRTESPSGQTWNPRYVQLSSDEPSDARVLLDTLRKTFEQVTAVISIVGALCTLTDPPSETLFAQNLKSPWESFGVLLAEKSRALGLVFEQSTRVLSLGHSRFQLPDEVPDDHGLASLRAAMVRHCEALAREVQRHLSENYRPNFAHPPLPSIYVIDVTRAKSLPTDDLIRPEVFSHSLQQPCPTSVRIGMLNTGLPYSSLDFKHKQYVSDERRRQVKSLTLAAIEAAASKSAKLLLLPEYWLPRGAEREVVDRASKLGLAIVAGIEADIVRGRPSNRALIYIDGQTQYQFKHRPSIYEAANLWSDHRQHVFENTSIGSFAVLICSDFLELDLVYDAALHATDLDMLLVPCLNPHPVLFQSLAAGDAARLYTAVAIANNGMSEADPESVSAEGTCVLSPQADLHGIVPLRAIDEQQIFSPFESVSHLSLFDLPIEKLDKLSGRPRKGGFIQVPHFRRKRSRVSLPPDMDSGALGD